MSLEYRLILSLALIACGTSAGYLSRRRGWLPETAADRMMTAVAVAGYPSIGFLAIWQTTLTLSALWLPTLAAVQTTLMALTALALGRRLFPDRAERGLVGLSCGMGNHGVTMAGFVIYLLFGETGLGLSMVYGLYTFFSLVLLSYTVAQAHSAASPRRTIGRLMLDNLLHWRSAGLYACLAAIVLTAGDVPVPDSIARWHIMDILIFGVIGTAYFAIGFRLHFSKLRGMGRAIIVTLAVRHIIGPLIGVALVAITLLTPWPLTDLALKIFLIQSSVSMAVTAVAVSAMFRIRAKEASALFIVSSAFYIVVGVPLVLLIFR